MNDSATDLESGAVVSKLTQRGQRLWRIRLNNYSYPEHGVRDTLCVVPDGRIYICGGLLRTDRAVGFLSKLTANGEVLWLKTGNRPEDGPFSSVTVGRIGTLCVAGFPTGTVFLPDGRQLPTHFNVDRPVGPTRDGGFLLNYFDVTGAVNVIGRRRWEGNTDIFLPLGIVPDGKDGWIEAGHRNGTKSGEVSFVRIDSKGNQTLLGIQSGYSYRQRTWGAYKSNWFLAAPDGTLRIICSVQIPYPFPDSVGRVEITALKVE